MILPFISDGELALAEFGELEEVIFAMVYLGFWVLWVLSFVTMCGLALTIRRAHVH
jgi:hypothetical protein